MRDKEFIIAKNLKYDAINVDLFKWFINSLMTKLLVVVLKYFNEKYFKQKIISRVTQTNY